jgi:hypothetical protein
MVLLITALVLMIVSATAVYAVQQGAFEVRAAGSARQATRTRYVSESAVMAGLACIEDNGCKLGKAAGDVWRTKYGVPAPKSDPLAAQSETHAEIRPEDFTKWFATEIAPSDSVLSNGDFVTAYTPSNLLVWEVWDLTDDASTSTTTLVKKQTLRYVATAYGELGMTNDAVAAGETRGIHETISISRAYYTKR